MAARFGSMHMVGYRFPAATPAQKVQIGKDLVIALQEAFPTQGSWRRGWQDQFYGKADPDGGCILFAVYDKDNQKAIEAIKDFFAHGTEIGFGDKLRKIGLGKLADWLGIRRARGVDSELYTDESSIEFLNLETGNGEARLVRNAADLKQRKAKINEMLQEAARLRKLEKAP